MPTGIKEPTSTIRVSLTEHRKYIYYDTSFHLSPSYSIEEMCLLSFRAPQVESLTSRVDSSSGEVSYVKLETKLKLKHSHANSAPQGKTACFACSESCIGAVVQ